MRANARTTISLEHRLLQEIDDFIKEHPEYRNRSHLIKNAVHEFFRRRNAMRLSPEDIRVEATIAGDDAKTILTWIQSWGVPEDEAVRQIVRNYINEHLEKENEHIHKKKKTCGEAPEIPTVIAPEGKGKE